jgi:hypothetical protein
MTGLFAWDIMIYYTMLSFEYWIYVLVQDLRLK